MTLVLGYAAISLAFQAVCAKSLRTVLWLIGIIALVSSEYAYGCEAERTAEGCEYLSCYALGSWEWGWC